MAMSTLWRIVGAVLCGACFAASGGELLNNAGSGPDPPIQVRIVYEPPASIDLQDSAERLRATRILEEWSQDVGLAFRSLPLSIETVFTECGNPHNRYEPTRRQMILCYEHEVLRFDLINEGSRRPTASNPAWRGSILHELYHEFAHALIDALALPIVGNEEEAADDFAIIALLRYENGAELALGAADFLGDLAHIEMQAGILDPSDAHPFVAQRYYRALCMIYGSNPQKFKFVVEQARLPRRRASLCREEYVQADRGWRTLLPASK